MFNLKLGSETQRLEDVTYLEGWIVIDDFEERFLASDSYWTKKNYVEHWRTALKSFLQTAQPTALITSITEPYTANFFEAWVIYAKGDKIAVRNQILFLEGKRRDAIAGNFNFLIPEYTPSEDLAPISEWMTDKNSLNEFLTHLV